MMSYTRQILRALLVLAGALVLTACSKTVQWEEEVPLNTGDTIWVTREVTYKFQVTQDNPFVPSYRPTSDEKLKFEWMGQKYLFSGTKRLILLAISPVTQHPVLIEPKEWENATDDPCQTPFYSQISFSKSLQKWHNLPSVEPWIFNMERNLMANRIDIQNMQMRYSTHDRSVMDKNISIFSPSMMHIDPNYKPEVCHR